MVQSFGFEKKMNIRNEQECVENGGVWVPSHISNGIIIRDYCRKKGTREPHPDVPVLNRLNIDNTDKEFLSSINRITHEENLSDHEKKLELSELFRKYNIKTVANDGNDITDGIFRLPKSGIWIYYDYKDDDIDHGEWVVDTHRRR